MDFTYNPQTNNAMYFELFIIIISIIMLSLIFRRYLIKRNNITLLLFVIFVFLGLSVLFSYLSKVLWTVYFENQLLMDSDPLLKMKSLIIDYRITYICSVIAAYLSYVFQSKIYDKTTPKIQNYLFLISALVIVLLAIFIYNINDSIWNTIISSLTMLYTVIIYSLFLSKSIKLYKRLELENEIERNAIKSLVIMSLCFILIYIFALLSQVLYLFVGNAYNIMYYLMWIAGIAAYVTAYFGYLNPINKNK